MCRLVRTSITILLAVVGSCAAFGIPNHDLRAATTALVSARHRRTNAWSMSPEGESTPDNNGNGVIELVDVEERDEKAAAVVAPFLSQGEIQPESLKVDLSDPKQTRVIIYIIISLLPVLFLIPLMLGSREFLPAILPIDELPPVQM